MRAIAAVLIFAAAAAFARDENGLLDTIVSPNGGKPVIAEPGDRFTAIVRESGPLFAVHDDKRIPVEVIWEEKEGVFYGDARMPDGLTEGFATLELEALGRTDREFRALYIAGRQESNYIAIAAGAVAVDAADPDTANALKRLFDAINESPAAFAVITGPLTANGAPEEFEQWLRLLADVAIPTYLVCGPPDRAHFEQYFGPTAYSFVCNNDGFLVVDASGAPPVRDESVQAGVLQRMRREIKPRRWSVGFAHRYTMHMGMRAQITLFVDDPLDYLFVSEFGEEQGELDADPVLPWSTTPTALLPQLKDGMIRILQFRPDGVAPSGPQRVTQSE